MPHEKCRKRFDSGSLMLCKLNPEVHWKQFGRKIETKLTKMSNAAHEKKKVCVYKYYFLRVTAEEQKAGMTLNQHLLSMSMSEKPTRKNKISFVSL